MIFVDSSAWVAAAVRTDARYPAARGWFAQNRQTLLTTDYVMDEVITYLRTRKHRRLAIQMGRDLMESQTALFHLVTPAEL
jgi:predicted nucleic acid-binding protein